MDRAFQAARAYSVRVPDAVGRALMQEIQSRERVPSFAGRAIAHLSHGMLAAGGFAAAATGILLLAVVSSFHVNESQASLSQPRPQAVQDLRPMDVRIREAMAEGAVSRSTSSTSVVSPGLRARVMLPMREG